MFKRFFTQGIFRHGIIRHSVLTWFCLLPLVFLAHERPQEKASENHSNPRQNEPKFRTELIRGRVQWLAEALQNDYGISSVPEVSENALAILTEQGKLFPIVENLRGRAFRKDTRLRDKDLELLVRTYEKHPYVQIVSVYEVEQDRRYEIDYWCDICAIVMYETGPCACCQDTNRMRKRIVENGETQDEKER